MLVDEKLSVLLLRRDRISILVMIIEPVNSYIHTGFNPSLASSMTTPPRYLRDKVESMVDVVEEVLQGAIMSV